MATDMGLGGCAIGSINIELFAKMTGIEFHVEGPVGTIRDRSRHETGFRLTLRSPCAGELTKTSAGPAGRMDRAV